MSLFSHRSRQLELLDAPQIPFADIRQNMRELDTINTLLGGHRITLKGLEALLHPQHKAQQFSLLEIGCGDGNNLRVIKQWALKKGYKLELTGVDYNPSCIDYAQQVPENEGIRFYCSDYRQTPIQVKPHFIFSSLFCHHFSNRELVAQLQWMQQNSLLGFFINDLHRHPLAYHSIRLLTRLFSKSYLVKNDAPLSVLRGFTKPEWKALLQQADLKEASCTWMWAFRWLIVAHHQYTPNQQKETF
jgi:SAM-dependent methyltransferase